MFSRRRIPWYVSVPLIASSALVAGAAKWRGGIPVCETAKLWVAEHLAELPATLSAVSHYTVAYRRAIVPSLKLDEQKRLWREHLSAFIDPIDSLNSVQRAIAHSSFSLTEHQRALIRQQIARLDVYFADGATLEMRRVAASTSVARIKGAFTKSAAASIFGTLGPTESATARTARKAPIANTASFGLDFLVDRIASLRSGSPTSRTPDCTCNIGGEGCSNCCVDTGNSCMDTPSGCGFFFLWPCDGECLMCRP